MTEPRARQLARAKLAVFIGSVVVCLAVALSKDTTAPLIPPPGATTDLDLFRSVVNRVHKGDGFYRASHEELRSHGYPTRSVFNWRTPFYAWLLGTAPSLEWGRWLLVAGMIAVVATNGRDLSEEFGIVPATLSLFFLVGATAWCLGGQIFLFMEIWAGLLIALSISAYRRGWNRAGVAAGLLAVFFRELALPYALVAACLAVFHNRKREAAAWFLGLLLFVIFMIFHTYQVRIRLTPSDLELRGGWVRFGGVRFLLLTARTNILLMALPLWMTALYLPFATLGLTAARGEQGWRVGLTVGLFLAAFSVVGNPFNFYWGFLTAPLLARGLAGTPRAFSRLLSTAFDLEKRSA